MKYIKGYENYNCIEPSAITIGKFDGVHRGHDLLISRVEKHQKEDQVVGVVFAFDMKKPDFLLTSEEKADALKDRVDYFINCPFDKHISSMEAEDFIKNIVVDKFHAKYVVVGSDFRFGHQKRGDVEMLRKYGPEYGFEVEVFEKICYGDREISSSYIKEELKNGNTILANELLGYDYKK